MTTEHGLEFENIAHPVLGIARAGDVVFLELTETMPREKEEQITAMLDRVLEGTGVKCILLGPTVKVARIEAKA